MLGTSKVIDDGSGAAVLKVRRVMLVVTSPDVVTPYAHTRYSVSHSATSKKSSELYVLVPTLVSNSIISSSVMPYICDAYAQYE